MKIIHGLIFLIFFGFAILQFNDPDPLGWILLYLCVAATAIFYLFKQYFILLPVSGLFVCVLGILFLSPDFFTWVKEGMPTITASMKAENPHIELVREFLGFIISGLTFLGYYLAMHKKPLPI